MCKEEVLTYFKVLSQHFSGGTEETHSQYPGQDMKMASPKHKSKVLTSEPTRSSTTHQLSSNSVEALNNNTPDRSFWPSK